MFHKFLYHLRVVGICERHSRAATTQQLASRRNSDLHAPTLTTAPASRHHKLTPATSARQNALPHRTGNRKQNRWYTWVALKHKHVALLHARRHIAINHARLSVQRNFHNRAQPAGVTVPVSHAIRRFRKHVIAAARTRKTMTHIHAIPADRVQRVHNNGRVSPHSHSKQRHNKLFSTRVRE